MFRFGHSCPATRAPHASITAGTASSVDSSMCVISAHADRIISVVTVTASDRYAVAVARAGVSDVLNRQALSLGHSADDRAQHRAEPAA
jgi:hypothetical protein